jgi:hypothetical protein
VAGLLEWCHSTCTLDIEGAKEMWESYQGHLPFELGDWLEETRVEYEDDHAYYVHAGSFQANLSGAHRVFTKCGVPGDFW